MIADWSKLAAHYGSASGDRYFDWPDAPGKGPKVLAQMFLGRFPEIADEGYGPDWEYAGWYAWMLAVTAPNALPYAFSDYHPSDEYIPTLTYDGTVRVPLPPPGEAESEVGLE
jgi:hypothetical protein